MLQYCSQNQKCSRTTWNIRRVISGTLKARSSNQNENWRFRCLVRPIQSRICASEIIHVGCSGPVFVRPREARVAEALEVAAEALRIAAPTGQNHIGAENGHWSMSRRAWNQTSTAGNPQPVLSQAYTLYTARNTQLGIPSQESRARSPQPGVNSQGSIARIDQPSAWSQGSDKHWFPLRSSNEPR